MEEFNTDKTIEALNKILSLFSLLDLKDSEAYKQFSKIKKSLIAYRSVENGEKIMKEVIRFELEDEQAAVFNLAIDLTMHNRQEAILIIINAGIKSVLENANKMLTRRLEQGHT